MRLKINLFWKVTLSVVLASSLYSMVPLIGLYVQKDPPIVTNAQAISKIKANEGPLQSFIVFGDNHAGLFFDDSATLKLAARMNREGRFKKMPVDFVISPGDVTFRASAWDYRNWNKIKSRIKYPVLCGMGNHDNDRDEKEEKLFRKYNGAKEFSFANKNSYFMVLDDNDGGLTDKQLARFEEELKASSAYVNRFVIMHKAPISPYQQSWYRPELSPWAYKFMKLCEKYSVDIVFSGHEHMSKTMSFGGVTYVITGGGGIITQIPEWDGGFLHYVVVRVCGDYVDFEVRKVFPPVWEYFTYYMWKNLFYFLKDVFL